MSEEDKTKIIEVLKEEADDERKKEKMKKLAILMATSNNNKNKNDNKPKWRINKLNTEKKAKEKVINEKINENEQINKLK